VNQAQKALFSILKNILIQAVPDRSQLKRLNAKVELILLCGCEAGGFENLKITQVHLSFCQDFKKFEQHICGLW
jgi:hypothetical protein